MRVLISGGGIAGLTLAYWLHQYGIPSVVAEQAEHLRQEGYGLDFYGTGYDVAEQMGILDRLRQQQIPVESISYITAQGQRIAGLGSKLMRKVLHGRYLALMHGTLEEALYQAIANDVEVRYGTTIAAVESKRDGVAVTFCDGATASFDVLIGADGVHSHTRRLVFGPDPLFQHSLGYFFACYPLPDRYGIGYARKNYVEPGRLTIAYNTNREGEIVAFFLFRAADAGPVPREQRLLADVPDPDAILLDAMTQIQMPSWHLGRVALVGDACGSLTAMSGQGASMAVGGAYFLARALHEERDYAAAFRRYQQLVRPAVEQRQKNARTNIRAFLPDSQPGLLMQRLLLKLVLRETFSGLLVQQFGAGSLLQSSQSVSSLKGGRP